jgi:beta-1,4-mannosyl-glycoprotein beta-1,4-N-acetylglucosaminyltransferase
MIIDSFMFFNEFDILEGRLEYLYDHVDYFVLVESNLTHGGQPKPMHFMENMSRYKKYLDKVIYMPYAASVDQFEYNKMPTHDRDFETGPWQMENAQRNHIAKALEFFPEDALLLISDVDEIPHKDCMAIAENSFKDFGPILAIQQTYYCYNFNQKYKNPWHGTVATKCGYAKANTPQFCRNHKYNIPVISQGGWHLTYWGTPEHIATKVKSFAHQELNTERFTDPEYIKQQVAAGKDLFSRDWNEFIPEDPNNIPPEIRQIFGNLHEKLSSIAK